MKARDGSEDKFGPRANLYASARPAYPRPLVQHFVSLIPYENRKWALDVGAGSGQLSIPLAEYFGKVVALDKSERQLEHGPRTIATPNISYRVGLATELPLPQETTDADDGEPTTSCYSCFDVVTCAQAYHWFVAEKIDHVFLAEACRVLQPNHGRLGIFGYGVCTIASSPALEQVFKKFYLDDLGSNLPPSSPANYWDIDRRLLDSSLEGVPTHGLVEIVERRTQVEKRSMSTQAFLNYVRTFSALSNLQKKCSLQGEMDPMEKLHRDFEAISREDEVLEVEFPFFLVVMKPAKKIL